MPKAVHTARVLINSPGERVDKGMGPYDYFQSRPGVTIITEASGQCGSIATAVFLAGPECIIPLPPKALDAPAHRRHQRGHNLMDDCGVRIHLSNTAADTKGCLLPDSAFWANRSSVLNSRAAFDRLFLLVGLAVQNNEPITLTIK